MLCIHRGMASANTSYGGLRQIQEKMHYQASSFTRFHRVVWRCSRSWFLSRSSSRRRDALDFLHLFKKERWQKGTLTFFSFYVSCSCENVQETGETFESRLPSLTKRGDRKRSFFHLFFFIVDMVFDSCLEDCPPRETCCWKLKLVKGVDWGQCACIPTFSNGPLELR